jgi:hypothetical protein
MVNKIVEGKTQSASLGDKTIRKVAQMMLVPAAVLRFEMAGAYKCSYSPSRLHNSAAFQFSIDLRHGIGVNPKIYRKLPHGRQLLSNA